MRVSLQHIHKRYKDRQNVKSDSKECPFQKAKSNFHDLKGHNFKVTGLEEAPFINYIILNSVTGKYEMEGSFTDLLNILANIMNFTYTWTLPPDNAWGGLQKDGSWNGMIKLLINEDVDFCKIAYICWLF